jgi:hypothetical protein
MTPDDAKLWIIDFIHDTTARALADLVGWEPALRMTIRASDALGVAAVNVLFDRMNPSIQGVFPMAAANKPALMAAGVPAEHCDAVAALGVTPDQAKQMVALGFDIAKLIQALPQLFAILLSLFAQAPPTPTLPTGAGTPPPTSPK